ncbi:MAG: methyltransferase domain-containing protein [Thermoplasmata archaeon]
MKAYATWVTGYESRLRDDRGHDVTVDLPKDEDGADRGTSSLELNVLSLAGCISTIFALVARRRRIAFTALSVELEAERPRGSKTIARVSGTLTISTVSSPADVATALAITMRTCPVGVLYEQAKVPVEVRVVVEAGGTDAAAPTSPPPAPREPPTSGHHADHPGHGHAAMHGRAWGREEALEALEDPRRRETQDTDVLWDRVGLPPGTVVADVGAGTGYFALPAARRVGESGRVYAIDLSPELVGLVRERAEEAHLPQLTAVANSLDRIPLASEVADVVLLANVLHDIPPATVAEAVRLLKPHERLVNLDWKVSDSPGGPPAVVRYSPERATEILASYGLVRKDAWELGPYHYVLLFEKTASSETRASVER